MKERSQIILVMLLILVISGIQIYLYAFLNGFTFSEAELDIDGTHVNERLTFNPNKPYHTLYRNFENIDVAIDEEILAQYRRIAPYTRSSQIIIDSVRCSAGTPYANTIMTGIYLPDEEYIKLVDNRMPYTEFDEYGCGFGETYGFKKNHEYTVEAGYTIDAKNIVEIDGNYYIKFRVYSPKKHPMLIRGSNFKVTGDGIISSKIYFPKEEVNIYIPFDKEDGKSYAVTKENEFKPTNGFTAIFIIFSLIPVILAFIVWRIFGKENVEGNYPEELSQYPKERKAWEVSIYFHPPFGNLDESFLPTMIMDFYNRKIIDIKEDNKILKIKILKRDAVLDDIEKKFMEFLEDAERIAEKKNDYFSIKDASSKFLQGREMSTMYMELQKLAKKKSKEYIDYKGTNILTYGIVIILCIQAIIFRLFDSVFEIFLYAFAFLIAYICRKSALFTKYKKDYYLEYEQWQGFKNYLSHLDSMKRSPPQGVILWEKYLVFATALGVGKKVAEKLKEWSVIDSGRSAAYIAIYNQGSYGIAGSSGGGGFSGGGGGIGGGGGGGR